MEHLALARRERFQRRAMERGRADIFCRRISRRVIGRAIDPDRPDESPVLRERHDLTCNPPPMACIRISHWLDGARGPVAFWDPIPISESRTFVADHRIQLRLSLCTVPAGNEASRVVVASGVPKSLVPAIQGPGLPNRPRGKDLRLCVERRSENRRERGSVANPKRQKCSKRRGQMLGWASAPAAQAGQGVIRRGAHSDRFPTGSLTGDTRATLRTCSE